ncbi:MAG: hypothetical protein QOC92_4233 [Acidimicrobiaceae bacterium]|jgi:hypothetical protein
MWSVVEVDSGIDDLDHIEPLELVSGIVAVGVMCDPDP